MPQYTHGQCDNPEENQRESRACHVVAALNNPVLATFCGLLLCSWIAGHNARTTTPNVSLRHAGPASQKDKNPANPAHDLLFPKQTAIRIRGKHKLDRRN